MEQWKDNLAALVPHYGPDGGNATLIYTMDGEEEHDCRTVKWNLRRLARIFCVDLEAARKRYGRRLERDRGVPVPFSSSLVLVPLKVRNAVGKNDGTSGYFNPFAVKVEPAEGGAGFRSTLLLPGDYRIHCCYTERTVKKRLKAGELILGQFFREAVLTHNKALPPETMRLVELMIMAAVGHKIPR